MLSEYAQSICLCLSSVNSRLNMLISGRSMYVRLCVFRCLFNLLCVHVCEVLVHVYKLSACLFVYQKSFKGSLYVKSGFFFLSEYLVSTMIICRKPNLNLINRTTTTKTKTTTTTTRTTTTTTAALQRCLRIPNFYRRHFAFF